MFTLPSPLRARGGSSRRVTGAAVAVGAAGSLAVALSMGASLSSFTASITNSQNTASSDTLAITETLDQVACNSYDATTTCSTINKYGGTDEALEPGDSQTTTVTFENVGGVDAATAVLDPGACSATATDAVGAATPTLPITSAGNLCSVLTVEVHEAADALGTPLYSGSLAGFTADQTLLRLDEGEEQAYTFKVTLPQAATVAVQGQQVSQPLAWTFNQ